MANNWYDDQRNQDDIFTRRGDDRTRDFGRGNDRESYRAGDDDAHRNDREMAFGNYNQRPTSQTGMNRGDQGFYGRHDMGFGYGGGGARDRDEWRNWRPEGRGFEQSYDRGTSRANPSERNFGNENTYESSRFSRSEPRDYGLGFGRDQGSGRQDFSQRHWSYGQDQQRGSFDSGYGSSMRGSSYTGRGPKGYRRSDERIREEVSECLERDPYIDASEIEVDVKDGVVTLRGHTEDRRQKRMAEDAVEHLSGVRDVRNELSINQTLFQRAKEALFGGSTESISDPSTDTSKGDLVTDGHTTQPKRNPRH